MLIGQPLPFIGVSVTCPNVLGLQVFQLAVDVVPVTHWSAGDVNLLSQKSIKLCEEKK